MSPRCGDSCFFIVACSCNSISVNSRRPRGFHREIGKSGAKPDVYVDVTRIARVNGQSGEVQANKERVHPGERR